jgi:hypothetical protein
MSETSLPPEGALGRRDDRVVVGVVGPGTADPARDAIAEEVGVLLARARAVVVCGGLGGVMAAACRGAANAGGLTVGILPGEDPRAANEWVAVPIPTGLGELRNGLVVRSSNVLVAIGGGYGTLSEVAFALKVGCPVVGLGTWTLVRPDGRTDPGVCPVADPAEAVARALGWHGPPCPPHPPDLRTWWQSTLEQRGLFPCGARAARNMKTEVIPSAT